MKRPLVNDYQFNLKLPRKMHRKLKARAKANGITASEYIRRLLALATAVT